MNREQNELMPSRSLDFHTKLNLKGQEKICLFLEVTESMIAVSKKRFRAESSLVQNQCRIL